MNQSASRSRQPNLRTILVRSLPILAIALLFSALAPLHAQMRDPIRKVPAVYPQIAKQMGITGSVVVTTTVDPAGKVIKAESNSGNKLLAGAAIDAVKQWKFAPGDSTDTFPVTINFTRD